MDRRVFSIVALALTIGAALAVAGNIDVSNHVSHDDLKSRIAKYAQVELGYDASVLSEPEKKALAKLVQAGAVMDQIFLVQVYEGNPEILAALQAMKDSGDKKVAEDLLHFFRINFGPWDRLDEDRPFIGDMPKPKGAGYYPLDLTADEFEQYAAANPDAADALKHYFTKIERANGKLVAVPYSDAYEAQLAKAAKLLNEAADILTGEDAKEKLGEGIDYTTLANFLRSRAAAFSSNDYFQSDMDWMDVKDNIIDVTIGPYEVYEDGLFAYKAAFEAFIAIRHPADSRKLADLKGYLPKMEMNLPIEDKYKNMDRGTDSPISVVDLAFAGGDTKAGVQTIAFNLPNDERVREAKGSKKVMLKNISEAKYDKILVPIAETVLDKKQMKYVTFDAYFSNVLMHELAHGLGPGKITLADGTETTVNQALQTLYSPLEECKADIMGMYNKAFLVEQDYMERADLEKAYVSFLPGFFRAIRFGATSAHGKANMMEYNYLKEKGAITLDPETDRYTVHIDKMPAAVEAMTRDLCMIQAQGDKDKAQAFLDKYGNVPEEVERQLAKLTDIPTDIEPVYTAEKYLGK